MTIEPNETQFVDVDTDDLNAFTTLFNGKAEATPVKEDTPTEEDPEDIDLAPDDEDTDTDETEDQDDQPEPEAQPKKKVNRSQERIDQLTANFREQERIAKSEREQRVATEARLAALEAKLTPAVKTAPTQEGALPDPNTKNEDGSDKYPLGEFDPSYIRDLNRQILREEQAIAKKEQEQEQATRQEQEARDYLQEQWMGKLSTTTEELPDFMDKTMELEAAFDGLNPQYSDYLVQTIKGMDRGPEVLYYFANHLDEAKKFVKLGPQAATMALGRYEALLDAKDAGKKETKVSKAPPPPQVNKGSSASKAVTGDTDDLRAFEKAFFKKR